MPRHLQTKPRSITKNNPHNTTLLMKDKWMSNVEDKMPQNPIPPNIIIRYPQHHPFDEGEMDEQVR